MHVVQFLLDLGTDLSYKFKNGMTLLHITCGVTKCYDLCKLLLEKGADCNSHSHLVGDTPLLIAVREQPLEVVQLLLNHGADIIARNRCGSAALSQISIWTGLPFY